MAGWPLFGHSKLESWLASASEDEARLVKAWFSTLLANPETIEHRAIPGRKHKAFFEWIPGTGVVVTYRLSRAPIRGVFLLTIEDVNELLA